MTHGAAQQSGKQIGTTAAPCLPSDSECFPLSLYPYSPLALALFLAPPPPELSRVVACETCTGVGEEVSPLRVDVNISPGG